MSTTTRRTYTVLFLCTGNSARSILSEALMNHAAKGRFQAYSAGSHPTGTINPFAVEILREMHVDPTQFRSKSWNEFAGVGTLELDFVFTVCDKAAGEICPHWPGQPMTAHWGIDDPAAVTGTDTEKRRAFANAAMQLKRRIELFLSLPVESIDSLALQSRLDEIGRLS